MSSRPRDEDYRHSLWSVKDGLFGTVQAVAQAKDGFLLVATSEGLFCFDGLVFRAVRESTGEPITGSISTMLPMESGDLWIGFELGGAALLHDGKLKRFIEQDGFPVARVRAFAMTPDGTVWAASVGGLARFSHSRWSRVEDESGYQGRSPGTVFTDSAGRLWVPSSHSVYLLNPGEEHFAPLAESSRKLAFGITEASDHSFWITENTRGDLERVSPASTKPRMPQWRPVNSNGFLLRDSRGQVWSATDGRAAWRGFPIDAVQIDALAVNTSLRSPKRSPFLPLNGVIRCIAEDKQGSIWFATTEGLERLQPTPIRWTPLQPSSSARVLVRGPHGRVHAGIASGILDVSQNRVLPGSPSNVLTAFADSFGRTWLGGKGSLTLWTTNGFHPVSLPNEASVRHPDGSFDPPIITSITVDGKETVHVGSGGSGEFLFDKDGQWRRLAISPEHPDWGSRSAYADDRGTVWYVLGDRVISETDGETTAYRTLSLQTFGRPNLIGGGLGEVWIGGESGIALLRGTEFLQLRECSDSAVGFITGFVREKTGLWIASTRGITFVSSNIIDDFKRSGHCVGPLQRFDTTTGLPEELQTTVGYGSSVVSDTDGVLWFATRGGVVSLDPRKNVIPLFKPSVHLVGFTGDDQSYPPSAAITLPVRTKRVQFQYTAVDLVSPQRLRFRYRLVGFETGWHDAVAERSATYNGLRPGTYHFEVVATNGGNIWSDPRSILTVQLPPAWNQTKTFYAIVVLTAAVLGLIALAFERDRHERSLQMAFKARTAERTRLARQLHDTLLQTLQGSNLIAEHASETVSSVPEARRIFGLLKDWLTRADGEGRAVLEVLREEPVEENIERALQSGVDQIPLCSGIVTIRCHQRSRPVHPAIREDILQICLEAVRNACVHSQSSVVLVDLYFERAFKVEIKDDGIGFDSSATPIKRPGHYGLAGMKERALEIRGRLSIDSSPKLGTLVRLMIPGKFVYAPSRPIARLQSMRRSLWR